MKINLPILAIAAALLIPSASDAQLRSFQNSFSGREEKAGSGTIRTESGDLRLERVFLRLDRNGDVFIRMYPRSFARTYSGRYHWENSRRIRVDLYQGIEHAVGTIEMNSIRGGDVTFGRIELRGQTSSGNTQRVEFRPDRPNSAGSTNETSVDSWNDRWGSGSGGWGSGGSGGGWGGSSESWSGSSAGRGNIDWKGRDYRISRADVRLERNGNLRVILSTSRGDVEIRSNRYRRSGDSVTADINRFANQSSNGDIRIRLSSRGNEVDSLDFRGRSDGSNFRGDFRR